MARWLHSTTDLFHWLLRQIFCMIVATVSRGVRDTWAWVLPGATCRVGVCAAIGTCLW